MVHRIFLADSAFPALSNTDKYYNREVERLACRALSERNTKPFERYAQPLFPRDVGCTCYDFSCSAYPCAESRDGFGVYLRNLLYFPRV